MGLGFVLKASWHWGPGEELQQPPQPRISSVSCRVGTVGMKMRHSLESNFDIEIPKLAFFNLLLYIFLEGSVYIESAQKANSHSHSHKNWHLTHYLGKMYPSHGSRHKF